MGRTALNGNPAATPSGSAVGCAGDAATESTCAPDAPPFPITSAVAGRVAGPEASG
jgi:hypothetical protein